MTIIIYLIRLVVSFFFGASLLCLILERYFAYSTKEWGLENNPLRIVMIVVVVIILILSGICLWVIR